MRIHIGLVSGILLAATTVAVSADTKIEFKTTEGGGSSMSSILIGQGKIRSDMSTGMVIIDPAEGSMTIVANDKKEYTKITKADMKQIADMLAMLEQQMAGMPAEMRQMMASRMGGPGAGQPVAVTTDTGEKATVAGKSCRIFRTTQGGRTTQERCLAEPSAMSVPAADQATMVAAIAMTKDIMDTMSKSPMFGQIAATSPFPSGLVPLRTTTIDASGTRSTSELVGVSNAALPADTFTIPSGYKEQKLPTGRGRGGN
jgi:hypothetical protein